MSIRTVEKTHRLVMLAKKGDEHALAQLCSVYTERIRRIVRLRMGPELRSQLESMDLVQDVLINAVRDLGGFSFRDGGDFLRWLSRVTENRIRNQIARIHAGKRDVRKQIALDDRDMFVSDHRARVALPVVTSTPSVVLSRREDLDRLERAMDQLKPEYREVLLLVRIEGLSHQEAGRKMGKSPAAVAMLLSRAIVALTDAHKRV